MNLSYEKSFTRLEEILEKMNSGKLSLEESLKLYEEANTLITTCTTNLKKAEEKIEILIQKRSGSIETQPLAL